MFTTGIFPSPPISSLLLFMPSCSPSPTPLVTPKNYLSFAAILIALSVIVVPFRIGFDASPEGGWVIVDIVTDVTFAFDIILNFRMAYTNGHVLVTSPGLMASHYLKGWFTIDLLSTVPFDR